MRALVRLLLAVLPRSGRDRLLHHREVVKFLFVGGLCFLFTAGINYGLKLTVFSTQPVIP